MPFWMTLLISGLIVGCLYALMSFGVVVIYRATGVLNFAHTTMAALFALVFGRLIEDQGVPKPMALVLTVAFAFGAGVLLYQLLLRRLSGATLLSQIVATLAVALLLQAVLGVVFTTNVQTVPALFSTRAVSVLGAQLSWHQIGVAITTTLLGACLAVVFGRSKVGLAIRAVAANRDASRILGVNVERTEALMWGLATALAALAGILLAPLTLVDLRTVASLMVKVFAAALVGGLGSYGGAIAGALLLGGTEAIFGGYVRSSEIRESLPFFLVMIAVGTRALLIPWIAHLRASRSAAAPTPAVPAAA
ncbi:MAG: branched-chain amino acid ABC transporter permease [Actinomycetota bacterium]